MSFLKTTIKVESTNIFPSAINATKIKSTQLEGSSVGYATITTEVEQIVQELCGPKGSVVYLSSPSTNTETIKIWNSDYFTNQVSTAFITLKPGETSIVNLSPQQGSIIASTLNGTARLDYIIGDKGGLYGNSQLSTDFNGTGGSLRFTVTDAQSGETTPFVELNYKASDSWVYDGNAQHPWEYIKYVQGKGYCIILDNSNINQRAFIFINSRGQLIDAPLVLSNIDYADLYDWGQIDNLGFWVGAYANTPDAVIFLFDGDQVYPHSIPNASSWGPEILEDGSTANGSFLFNVNDSSLTTDDTAVILLHKGTLKVLDSYSYGATGIYKNAYVYKFANFILTTEIDDDNGGGRTNSFSIYDAQGNLLKTVNLLAIQRDVYSFDYSFYGDGKIQLAFWDNTDPDTNIQLFNYDESLNRLIGENLDWAYDRNNYNEIQILSRPKTIYYQDEWVNSSDRESMALIVYTRNSYNTSRFLNYELGDAKLVTLFDGDSQAYEYDISDKYIGLPSYLYDIQGISIKSQSISILTSLSGTVLTDLNLKVIKPGGVSTNTAVGSANLSYVSQNSQNSNSIKLVGFGEYTLFASYNTVLLKTFFKVFNSSGTLLDTLTINGTYGHTYVGFWRVQKNCLLIRDWDDQLASWFFNIKTGKFVKPSYMIAARDYGYNYSYKTGVNPGRMVLYTYEVSGDDGIRVLTSSGITSNVVIWNNHYNDWTTVGGKYIYNMYQAESGSDPLIVDIYDMSLNLVRSTDTGLNGFTYWDACNEFLRIVSDANPISKRVLISPDSTETVIYPFTNSTYVINDVVFND